MKYGKTLVVIGVLLMTVGALVASQSSGTSSAKQPTEAAMQAKASTTVHREMGTIATLSANELTLDHTWKGKDEKTTFVLEPGTRREGNVAQGDHVVVYYHLEKGQRIATELKASVAKHENGTNGTKKS
ncbi:MAG: hypothetical protein ACLQVG_33665 [Terriglobia bacterium]